MLSILASARLLTLSPIGKLKKRGVHEYSEVDCELPHRECSEGCGQWHSLVGG